MPTDHREIAFEEEINNLHEYCSALISAAVTGKIDVRGVNDLESP